MPGGWHDPAVAIMVNRTVLAHRLFTGLSRHYLACLVDELADRGRLGSRVVAILREAGSVSGLKVPAPVISWCSLIGWWPR